MESLKKQVKKLITWTLGIPAAIIAVCETENLEFWWMPFLGLDIVIALMAWNGAFREGANK